MSQKIRKKNLWNQDLAWRAIIESLELLEKEESYNKGRYFAQADIREKVLDIAVDVNGEKVVWKIIKPTFYRTLKSMVKAGALTPNKRKKMGIPPTFSYYRLNRFKDNSFELKESIKEYELKSIESALIKFPLYSQDIGVLTNINLSAKDYDSVSNDVKRIRKKVKKKWIEKEIGKYLGSLLKSAKSFEKSNGISNGYLLGYCLDHLNWWIKLNGEDPRKYRDFIDKKLNIKGSEKQQVHQYKRKIKNIIEKKKKWIEEISNRMWMNQPLTKYKNIEEAAREHHLSFLNKLKEVTDEGHLTKDDAHWLTIYHKLSSFLPLMDIYALPREKPIFIVKV